MVYTKVSSMIGKKLLKFRTENNLSRKTVGEIMDVSPQMVYKYEHDLSKPPIPRIKKLIKHFGLPIDTLLEDDDIFIAGGNPHPIVILDWVGLTDNITKEGIVAGAANEIIGEHTGDPNLFALKIKGESMAPLFIPGDIILVSPNTQPQNNALVVVKLKWEQEATFRVYTESVSGIMLRPLNDNYPSVFIDPSDADNIKILGVVIEMRRRAF